MIHFHGFKLKAQRQYLSRATWDDEKNEYDTRSCRTMDIEIEAHVLTNSNNGKLIVSVQHGAVTGHESFYVDDLVKDRDSHFTDTPFFWCAGTPGRWDSLSISAEEFRAMREELKAINDLHKLAGRWLGVTQL